ncbi:hypothetical protein SCLARK_001056 [Spiroplasma clarkii]|uniref:hypothetical protein n=1 Tax=Spiroplasma clarkii TaxID=2139 RepID=UPI000B54C382|nr:hypothetical protein [Spiroplasma clarkii]ARU91636.1 hypothetical protein SCLARK_001056 [Spiroplasma clarkii]
MKSLSVGESLIDIIIRPDKDKIFNIIGGAALNYATIYAQSDDNTSTLLSNVGSDEHGKKSKVFY